MGIKSLCWIFCYILILECNGAPKPPTPLSMKPIYRRFDTISGNPAVRTPFTTRGAGMSPNIPTFVSSPGYQKFANRRSPEYSDSFQMQDPFQSIFAILSPPSAGNFGGPPQRPIKSLDDAFKRGYQAGQSVALGESMRNQRPICGPPGSGGNRDSKCFSSIYNIFFPPQGYENEDNGMLIPDDFQVVPPFNPNIFGVDESGMLIPVGELDDIVIDFDGTGDGEGLTQTIPEAFVTSNQVTVDSDGNINITPTSAIDTSANTPVGSLSSSSDIDISSGPQVLVPVVSE